MMKKIVSLLIASLLLLAAYFGMRVCRNKGRSSSAALLIGALVCLGVRMVLQIFYIVQFLVEVEFAPYASEIIQMIGEILQTVAMSGGAVWLSAVAVYALLAKICPAEQ